MSVVYQFNVLVDFPNGTNTTVAETVLAQSIAIELVDAKVPGNVLVTLLQVLQQTSVADFSVQAALPIPIKSNGVSTWPGAVAIVSPVTIPVSLVSENDPPIVVTLPAPVAVGAIV